MFHPTQHTPSLDESDRFFQRFFGRETKMAEPALRAIVPPDSGYPVDYCAFTMIRDVLFDSVDPDRYVLGGVQAYPSVSAPVLRTTGWYVEGLGELFRELRARGLAVIDTLGRPVETFQAESAVAGGQPMYFTSPAETGVRYQFYAESPFFFDPRSQPGWTLPPVEPDCPFGLERCAWHTVLTARPERVLPLFVEVLGGTIIDRGRNEALGATSTFVSLADGVFEFAVPDAGTPAFAALDAQAPHDCYYALTWKVADLDRAARHLEAIGAGCLARTADTIVCDPAGGFGVPWGFTTALRPGDPRAAA